MRELIAFGLLTLLVGGVSFAAVWLHHNSHEKRYRRQQRIDRERYRSVMAEKSGVHDSQT